MRQTRRWMKKLRRLNGSPLYIGVVMVASLAILTTAGIILLNNKDDGNVNGGTTPIMDKKSLPPLNYANEVEKSALVNLRNFGLWLSDNKAKGFIGEVGWPSNNPKWGAVADKWYQEANRFNIWVTAWAAGSWWGNYPLAIYTHEEGAHSLDNYRSQALIVEKHSSTNSYMRGVNLAGMEFGTEDKDQFNSANPGIVGQNYFYEPQDSIKYLADRDVKLIRLPFRWERIQRLLGGELREAEISAINDVMDTANQHGMKVILDLHNYGVYRSPSGERKLGTTLSHEQLVDVWLRLSKEFKDHPALAAYGLMNEPHDLPAGQYESPAKNWESASQKVLHELRDAGDNTLIMVAGYDWSSVARWAKNHPEGWIKDPINNFRYEAHHYWDRDGSGFYERTFQEELR